MTNHLSENEELSDEIYDHVHKMWAKHEKMPLMPKHEAVLQTVSELLPFIRQRQSSYAAALLKEFEAEWHQSGNPDFMSRRFQELIKREETGNEL